MIRNAFQNSSSPQAANLGLTAFSILEENDPLRYP